MKEVHSSCDGGCKYTEEEYAEKWVELINDKYCEIKLNDISEWVEIINENDCLIVLIDDIFDKHLIDISVPIRLNEREVYEIANTDTNPLMGYPESCYLFTSNREFTRLGVGFFKHPTKSLCNEIESVRNNGNNNQGKALEYAILVYIALSDDLLDLHDINICKFNNVHELLYHKKELTVQNIRRGLGQLTKRYLKTNPNGTYSFQHRNIFETVLLSYNDIEKETLIPLLHIDFILEMGRLEGYISKPEMKNEITMLFDKDMYKILAQKIISELKKIDYVDSFIRKLCSSRIIRNADENFIDGLNKEYKLNKCSIYSTVHHLDSEAAREKYMSKIDEIYIPSKRTSGSFLTLLLKYSIKYEDADDTIRNILKIMQHDLQVEKNTFVNESHEKCFTEAILKSCAYLNKPRLNMLWQFMKMNRIRFDTETFHSFNICSFKKRTIAALQLLSCTVLTSDLVDSNDI
ncbi:unnamed protein product [Mytilus coruscus]|uniref:Uncharacterized protein n=1 Tax=Mytilus coruscus TaxID=42192 RepID=A0A6J8EY98_MYTCO|nr:unnamed protein product [Mytilus coruscus]